MALGVKNPPANAEDAGDVGSLQEAPLRRAWQPAPVFSPGESPGQRSQVGYSPCLHKTAGHNGETESTRATTRHRAPGPKLKCLFVILRFLS